MTEEIKEMLHCIEMNCKHNKCFGGVKLDEEDCKLLLDYITNLQQLYENGLKVNQNSHKYITELEMNNAILKEELKNRPIVDFIFDVYKELENYKQRNGKAIEYIENNKKETSSHFNGKKYVYRNFTLCCEPNDLLNILNGVDENE